MCSMEEEGFAVLRIITLGCQERAIVLFILAFCCIFILAKKGRLFVCAWGGHSFPSQRHLCLCNNSMQWVFRRREKEFSVSLYAFARVIKKRGDKGNVPHLFIFHGFSPEQNNGTAETAVGGHFLLSEDEILSRTLYFFKTVEGEKAHFPRQK